MGVKQPTLTCFDCLAFMLAYFCRILYSENPELEANLAFSNLQSALPLLEQANFDMDLVSRPFLRLHISGFEYHGNSFSSVFSYF